MLFLQLLHVSDLKTGFVFIGMSITKVTVGLTLFNCVCAFQASLSNPYFPLLETTGGISVWPLVLTPNTLQVSFPL